MFIAALFTIARTWKQPRCPLTDEWINKFWYLLRLIHVDVWQKPTKFCKAIILQLKININIKNKLWYIYKMEY